MDPQGNTTSGMGVEKNEVENTIYELLLGESKLEDCIIPLNFDNLSLIPSNVNLAGAEIELIGVEDKEFILKNAIDQVRDQYDFIIIDCPPSLNMLTINAMTTADTVLVPIQCEYYALEGLSQLMHTIELVQERLHRWTACRIVDRHTVARCLRKADISRNNGFVDILIQAVFYVFYYQQRKIRSRIVQGKDNAFHLQFRIQTLLHQLNRVQSWDKPSSA